MSHLQPSLDPVRRALSAASLAFCFAAQSFAQAPAGTQGPAAPHEPPARDGAERDNSLVPPPPAPEDVTLLRLRESGPRFGAIVGHTAEHVEFALLATGGIVRVPWSMIEPGQSNELQTKFGYIDIVAEEILVDAERLVLTNGATIEGIIVAREGDAFTVKTEGNLQAVPKSRVTAIEQGLRVPALDIYSAEELYNQYAAQASPTDPAAQWELAETCERLFAFARAAEHYAKVAELDPTYRAAELANILPRVRLKEQQQVQLDYLRESDRWRKRGQWDKSLELLQTFDEVFPNSALSGDAAKQKARLLQTRDVFAQGYVADRWDHWMRKLTRELALENTLVTARAYAEEQLSEEIQKAVLADLQRKVWKDAQLEQVKQIFAARRKVAYKSTTYGAGTFLLGLEAAQRGAEDPDEAAKKEPATETDANRDALAAKIAQFMKNQRVASRGKKAEDEEDLQQRFWETFSATHRGMWLLAYYAENCGDLEVRPRPTLTPCNMCAGKGAIEILLTGGGSVPENNGGNGGNTDNGQQLQTCPVCQGVQVVRRVYFR